MELMRDIREVHKDYHNRSILYVEDNKKVRDQTVDFLTKFFDNVDEANDGQEGLSMFNKNSYDIVISDLEMPKMNGRDMLKAIKDKNTETILIIMTASDSNIDESEIISDFYLNKPVSIEDFVKAFKFLKNKLTKQQ